MKIFFASPSTTHQGALPNSKIWRINLYFPLLDLGHEVETFKYDYSGFLENLSPAIPKHVDFVRKNREKFSEELIKQVRRSHARKPIKLFFSAFYSSFIFPEAIKEISKMGIITVNWYCNASYQFHLISEIAPSYDYCLVPEKFRLEDYKKIGARPIYCQEAANPNFYRPYPVKKIYDVTFVGQRYGSRPMYISSLLESGVSTRVWGAHWVDKNLPPPKSFVANLKSLFVPDKSKFYSLPNHVLGGVLNDKDLIKMYSKSKISLGFSEVAKSPPGQPVIKQVRLRDFEAVMSGAFYLVEAFDEIGDFFTPGKEIEFFNSRDELVQKTKFYLSHDSARERIRNAGLKKALKEHTWHKRFQAVFKQIGI